jgi:hypothetical protein
MGALEEERLDRVLGHFGAVAEEVDAIGGRGDALGEHALPEQGVDEAGFA